jgi:hypothetical protein
MDIWQRIAWINLTYHKRRIFLNIKYINLSLFLNNFFFWLFYKNLNLKMKIKIKSWNAVATWVWNLDKDTCTIC